MAKLAQDSVEYQQTLKKYLAVKFKRMLARNYKTDHKTVEADIKPITVKNDNIPWLVNDLAGWLGQLQELGLEVRDVLGKELDEVFAVGSNYNGVQKTVSDDVAKEYFRVLMATSLENPIYKEQIPEYTDGPYNMVPSVGIWNQFYKVHADHFKGIVELITKTVIDPKKLGAREVSND